MTESPDERRERIDEARRDQAALHREIGYEYINLAVRPSAAKPWTEFNEAQAEGLDKRPPVTARCKDKPGEYQDYDAYNVPSPGRAKQMCGSCPFSTIDGDGTCGSFAEAERPAWGVWDGMVYGRKLADTERREDLKNTKAKEEA